MRIDYDNQPLRAMRRMRPFGLAAQCFTAYGHSIGAESHPRSQIVGVMRPFSDL